MSGDAVDWVAAKRRLEQGEATLARVLDVEGERLGLMLRERARRLALPERAPARHRDSIKVLIARSGSERYALALDRLAGVLRSVPCAPVAGGPPEMIGLFNGRGAVWAAFDLRRLLDTGASTEATGGRLVLLRHPQRRVALQVDEIDDARDFHGADLAKFAASSPNASAPIIAEVASDGLMLLDLDALWAHPSIEEAR